MTFKRIGLIILALALIVIYVSINPSEVDFLPKCPFYFTTGLYCPGCGSQRATHQLLNFNILGVLQQNILYLVCLVIAAYHFSVVGLNKYLDKKIYNYMNHPKTGWFLLAFVVGFWILRNIPQYPFNLLAPQ